MYVHCYTISKIPSYDYVDCCGFNGIGVMSSGVVHYYTEVGDMFRSINDKHANTEMNKSLCRNTFTSTSSKCGKEALGNSLETKNNGHAPLTLEATAIPPLLSQQIPEPLTHYECSDSTSCKSHKLLSSKPFLYQDQSTFGKGKPAAAVVDKSASPKVAKSSSDDGDDFCQLSVRKTCIVHLNLRFNSDHYLSSPSVEKCLVIKDAEITPGLYKRRLELHNPSCSDESTNLDVTERATDSTKHQVAAPLVREGKHFPSNEKKTGYIIFTSDLVKFSGSFWYRLPSRIAQAGRIAKNGCVFTMFHFREEYAVKKTVYRSKEISVHSQLCHPNIINLEAVLVGEKHEDDEDNHYVYHFMLKMELSFADVLSTRRDACLKHMKVQLIKKGEQWELVLVNVRHVLKSVLEALKYMHSRNFVHCKVKASEILIRRRCQCDDLLFCTCYQQQKPVVKLGDFSSSSDITGYEQLCITAIDIWSFGCLLLAIFIGKHGPLDLPTEGHVNEKLMEMQIYYGDIPRLCDLMEKCLQVHPYCRPTAKELLTLNIFTKPLYKLPASKLGPYTYL